MSVFKNKIRPVVPALVLAFFIFAGSFSNLAFAENLPQAQTSNSSQQSKNCDTQNMNLQTGLQCAKGKGQPDSLFFGDGSVFKRVSNILLFLVGSISVIMLIFGGIRYIVSGGNQTHVTAAKNTILYAIVGLVIAILAYAAVDFVVNSLMPK